MEIATKTERMLDRMEKMISEELPDPPIGRLIGLKVISISPGESLVELDAGPLDGCSLRQHFRYRRNLHDVGTENQFPQTRLEREVICGGEDGEPGSDHRHG